MKFIYIGELDRTPDAPDHMGIRQGLDMLGWDYKIVDPILNSPDEVVKQVNDFKPDLVVHGNTDSLSNGTIPRIEAKQVFFMGDVRPIGEYDWWQTWIQNSKGLSGIAISNRDQTKDWSDAFGVPAFFWPHGSFVPETLEYKPQFEYDLVFIGSMGTGGWQDARYHLIKEIERKSPVPITYINEGSVEGRNRVWRDMPAIYHSSKLILDISHFWDMDGYASGRYWYSAGLGGCSITKRFPSCEEFYKDKEHKLYFDTADEAVDLIRSYLSAPAERERIKRAAYQWNKDHHSYAIRFKQLLESL